MNAVSIIALIVSGCMLLVSLTTFVLNIIKDARKSEANFAKMELLLTQLQKSSDKIEADVKVLNDKLNAHSEDITLLKRDLKAAFSLIDELRESIKRIEKSGA